MTRCEVGQERPEGDGVGSAEERALEAEILETVGVEIRAHPVLLAGRLEEREVEARIVGDRQWRALVEPSDEGQRMGYVACARAVTWAQELLLLVEPPDGRR